MAQWSTLRRCYSYNNHISSRKTPPLSVLPVTLAVITSFLIVMYMTFTYDQYSLFVHTKISSSNPPLFLQSASEELNFDHDSVSVSARDKFGIICSSSSSSSMELSSHDKKNSSRILTGINTTTPPQGLGLGTSIGSSQYINDVFHDKEIFLQNYKQMKRTLKIYIYPHNALIPLDDKIEPGGNYASEAYFKNVLFNSHFITDDASAADLFFLPFSIASLRHDKRIGVGGLSNFVKEYMNNIRLNYPYWNRTGGADHFYVACHSIGRIAMEKVEHVKVNAIQVICSSSYFLTNYFAHKDVCLPQIWPRHEEPPNLASSQREKLAFFAGATNSPVRKELVQAWENDTSIFVYSGRLKTPYSEQLLGSKYCIHVKGFEVNTARIGDALYYGCVPVIIADYYDLPFMDILNWRSFSVVVPTSDIPKLKTILLSISLKEYSILQTNVLKVRKHFQWNKSPLDFDAFYMVMYELWLRRSSIRVLL